jgi:hypothetical protein
MVKKFKRLRELVVLNLDAKGVYSYGRGTRLVMTIHFAKLKKRSLHRNVDIEREENVPKARSCNLLSRRCRWEN